MIRSAYLVVLGLFVSCACSAAPILWDDFESGVKSPPWYKYPSSNHLFESDSRNAHSGERSGVAQPNWRYAYTAYMQLGQAYDGDVFLSAWVYDAVSAAPGLPAPPDNPNWSEEHVPNALIRLEGIYKRNTPQPPETTGRYIHESDPPEDEGVDTVEEFLHLGAIGKNKRENDPQRAANIYLTVDTAREREKILSGPPNSPVPVRREHGWRKYTIRMKPYTGLKGDVEFYVDSRLVYQGLRATNSEGPVPINVLALGSSIWTGDWYWYDDCEFDYWPAPTPVSNIQEAKNLADGEWVRIDQVSVTACYLDTVTVSDGAGGEINVYPARFEAPDDVLNVAGRMATSSEGVRYIESLVIEPVTSASVVDVSSIHEARSLPPGTRVRIPERIVTASLAGVRFVQEDDRSCGLRVRNIYEPAVGDRVIVQGQMMYSGSEVLLEAERVTIVARNQPLPKPLGLPNRSLYPPSTVPNGLVVATTGRVVSVPVAWYPAWVEIRDDSQGENAPPIRVQLPSYTVCPALGDYIRVVGAAGRLVEKRGERPQIFCRHLTDIQVIKPAP